MYYYDALNKGLAEGGIAEGITKGKAEGRAEGENSKMVEFILANHKKGKSVNEISNFLDVSEEEVKNILDGVKLNR